MIYHLNINLLTTSNKNKMPNWCSNYIKIFGDSKTISIISQACRRCEGKEDEHIFQNLIGIPEHMSLKEYNTKWYDTNVNWFGTKWDVSYESCNFEFGDDEIIMSPETAWSPPIEFLNNLVKMYKVKAYIFYNEGGIGFCGETNIYLDEDGELISDDTEYEYNEGMYLLSKDDFWANIEGDIESSLENEEELDDFLSRYSFVSNEDKLEITTLYNELKKNYETDNEGEDIQDNIS